MYHYHPDSSVVLLCNDDKCKAYHKDVDFTHALKHLPHDVNLDKVHMYCKSCNIFIPLPEFEVHPNNQELCNMIYHLDDDAFMRDVFEFYSKFDFVYCDFCDIYFEKSKYIKIHSIEKRHIGLVLKYYFKHDIKLWDAFYVGLKLRKIVPYN